MPTDPRRALFGCIHNSARSQMADAYLNAIGARRSRRKAPAGSGTASGSGWKRGLPSRTVVLREWQSAGQSGRSSKTFLTKGMVRRRLAISDSRSKRSIISSNVPISRGRCASIHWAVA